MRKPKFGKQRSSAVSSLSRKLPQLQLPKSIPQAPARRKPNVNKPAPVEGRRK